MLVYWWRFWMVRYGVAGLLFLMLAGCGSANDDHAGTDVGASDTTDEAEVEPETEPEPEPEPVEEEPDVDDEAAEEPDAGAEEPEEEPRGWQVPTVAYGTAADVDAGDEAVGVWSVVASEPECGVEIELGEFSFMEDPEPQGQWCRVEIAATNDADQPLVFWMDTEVALADWERRSFTPDSDATIEVNDDVYTETQVGQTFTVVAMFDLPTDVDLAGIAMTHTWTMEDVEPTVWAAE